MIRLKDVNLPKNPIADSSFDYKFWKILKVTRLEMLLFLPHNTLDFPHKLEEKVA